jgi:hypothetical protein
MNSIKSRGYKVLKLQETHPEEIGRASEPPQCSGSGPCYRQMRAFAI